MDTQEGMNSDARLIDITGQDLSTIPEFQPDDWPDITKAFTFYSKSWFCKPMKLIQRNEIIGIGNVIYLHDTAWLSQIIVRPENRNQGWGSILTQGLIDQSKAKVRTISLLATDLGFPVYQKLGFKNQGLYHFYQGEPLGLNGQKEFIADYDSICHCEILELDKEVSGEIRSRLLQDHLPFAKVIKHHDEVIAYYLPTLGEGQIISKHSDAGLELMQYHLRDKGKIVFPEENKNARNFILTKGFVPYRKAHRMFIGEVLNCKPEWIFSRIGGNLG